MQANTMGGMIQTKVVTLADGTATVPMPTGSRWSPLGVVPIDASAIAAETFGVVGTVISGVPQVDASFLGDAVIKSSNGSSAEVVVFAFLIY